MADRRKEFIKAAKAGDLAKLRALLASDESLLGVRDADGSTALHCATWKGHLEAVAYLLEAGSDVHVHNTMSTGARRRCTRPRMRITLRSSKF